MSKERFAVLKGRLLDAICALYVAERHLYAAEVYRRWNRWAEGKPVRIRWE